MTPQQGRVIGVQGFDIALSHARQRQGGGVVRRFWSIYDTATSPARRERWPSLSAFVTGDDGLDMDPAEFATVLGADAEAALREMGTGDPRYWERRALLTELRAEWEAEGPVLGAPEVGRPVAAKPVKEAANQQVSHNTSNTSINFERLDVPTIMARLRRDDPAAADRVARGESTAHFEAVQRGWRSPRIALGDPATVAGRLLDRYDADDLARLVATISAACPEAASLIVRLQGAQSRAAETLADAVARERRDGVGWRQIAEALGISERTARTRYGPGR